MPVRWEAEGSALVWIRGLAGPDNKHWAAGAVPIAMGGAVVVDVCGAERSRPRPVQRQDRSEQHPPSLDVSVPLRGVVRVVGKLLEQLRACLNARAGVVLVGVSGAKFSASIRSGTVVQASRGAKRQHRIGRDRDRPQLDQRSREVPDGVEAVLDRRQRQRLAGFAPPAITLGRRLGHGHDRALMRSRIRSGPHLMTVAIIGQISAG